MQSVRKERSLPPEERKAFSGSQWWGKKNPLSVSWHFLDDFFHVVRDIGIADRSFYASLRDVLGANCLQGTIGAGSLSPYNAERSSHSSLSE